MKNNKGFAITGIIYGLMVIFVFILSSFLAVVVGKNKRSEELLKSVYEDIEVKVFNVYSSGTKKVDVQKFDNNLKYITKERAKYVFYSDTDEENSCGEVYLPKGIEIEINTDGKAVYNTTNEIEGCNYNVCQSILNFEYTGAVQTYQIACPGKYKLEVWGAEGGSSNGRANSGKGGYSYGILTLSEKTTVYAYAGGQGISGDTTSTKEGGFNGGGNSAFYYGSSGGGASDIRIGTDSLYARVIVAGGGGGGGYSIVSSRAGGAGGDHCVSNYDVNYSGADGSFGKGANARTFPSSDYSSGGGGGGWYGGGSGGFCNIAGNGGTAISGGGGGSGYVYTSSTASYYPTGCLLNSSYYLTDAATIAGNQSFTDYDGTTVTGHSGNGYVRITYLR